MQIAVTTFPSPSRHLLPVVWAPPEGRRVSMDDGANVTTYVHSPLDSIYPLLEQRVGSNVTRYVHAERLLYDELPDGRIRVYHYDLRGSTVALSDETGTVIGRVEYGPYGELAQRFSDTDTPFLFVGAYGVQTYPNGLNHMRARYYSPETRRFLNADPIGFAGGLNWYAYAGGNPVMFVDPDGLAPFGFPSWPDYGREVGQVFAGYGDAAVGTVTGLYQVVLCQRLGKRKIQCPMYYRSNGPASPPFIKAREQGLGLQRQLTPG